VTAATFLSENLIRSRRTPPRFLWGLTTLRKSHSPSGLPSDSALPHNRGRPIV